MKSAPSGDDDFDMMISEKDEIVQALKSEIAEKAEKAEKKNKKEKKAMIKKMIQKEVQAQTQKLAEITKEMVIKQLQNE